MPTRREFMAAGIGAAGSEIFKESFGFVYEKLKEDNFESGEDAEKFAEVARDLSISNKELRTLFELTVNNSANITFQKENKGAIFFYVDGSVMVQPLTKNKDSDALLPRQTH